jgi:FAD/FMN-containing dehydrogenase
VALIARLAAQERFASLVFTPRGGGTGTNGQALNQGIIVDMSRYMNRIIEINPEEGWVRVEAGVIKDQLNQYLKPYGYFFARSSPPATARPLAG